LLNDRLVEMKNLRATSYYPIILAIEKLKFNENDINNILRAIETLIVRNFVVGGKVANKYEIEFAKIALNISSKKLIETESIIKTIKDLTLSDEEFIDDFKIFTSKNREHTKIISMLFLMKYMMKLYMKDITKSL